MERALYVPDLDRLPPAGGEFSRLYLGSEFCPWRLPSPAELDRALAAARERGMAFSLVTPFLDESALARTAALVRALPADGATEVVANDFGLLEAVAGSGWRGTVVAGRLLTRQRRGPGFEEPAGATPAAIEALRGSALDSPQFVAHLGATYGVRRFELDDLVQGVAVGALPAGVRLSLYRPFLLVTATRNCPWIFDGRTWDRSRGCARPCRGRSLTLEVEPGTPLSLEGRGQGEGGIVPSAGAAGEGRERAARTLLMGGCAQFLRFDDAERPLPPGVDRVVWQPGIPA